MASSSPAQPPSGRSDEPADAAAHSVSATATPSTAPAAAAAPVAPADAAAAARVSTAGPPSLTDSVSPLARPAPPPAVSFDKTLENILKLDTHDLEIAGDSLIVVDKAKRKKSRHTCGLGPTAASYRQAIPLYDVLWASVAAGERELVIEYAKKTSKTRLHAARLAIALASELPDRPTPAEAAAWAELLRARAYGPVPQRRRAYVLVNPHAGPGGADKLWAQHVRPLFDAARMRLTVVTTTHSGQAVELCAALDLDAYDMVVPCSGDGLPHEVFNGLGRRPDARRALARMPVAHIPCGSGNAMACNLYGTHHPSQAALAIVKGVVAPLDLVSITTPGGGRLLSFLSQAAGIVAECDLGTEHMRWMGGARFTVGFLQRLLSRKVYPCDLAVKIEIDHKDDVRGHYARNQKLLQQHQAQTAPPPPPHAAAGAQALRERAKLGSSTTTSEADDATDDAGASSGGSAAGDDKDADDSSDQGLPPLKYGTVDDAVPDGWDVVPGDKMGNFYCGNMAYMAPDTNFFSAALMNDGLMDLVTVDGDISPAKSLAMMLSVEDGGFFDNPLVVYRKISAFRLVPKNQDDGYISIDGERIPFGPLQAEVHRGLGRVVAKRAGGYEAPGPVRWDKVSVADRIMA